MDENEFMAVVLELFQLDDGDIEMDSGWRDNLISSIEITELVAVLEKEIGSSGFNKDAVNNVVKRNGTMREILKAATGR